MGITSRPPTSEFPDLVAIGTSLGAGGANAGGANAGGTNAMGGTATAKGGSSAAGGTKAIGGTTTTGGTKAVGGNSTMGGTKASGGSTGSGGTSTGGSKAAGGSTSGGTSATGGAVTCPTAGATSTTLMQSFLSYCKANNCLPDIACWHELGEPEGSQIDTPRPGYIPAHVAAYRAMETSLGITKRPVSINEYGIITEEGIPGSLIRYIAQFERLGIETANIAYWHQSGRLSDLTTSAKTANVGWSFYKFYGDMTGMMTMTTPPAIAKPALGLDGIASVDTNAKNVQVLFGGTSGSIAIVVQGLA